MSRPVVLVTGGSRGIGAAVAAGAALRGYDVAVNYQSDRSAADAVVGKVTDAGGQGAAFAANVSDEKAVVDLFASVSDHFGRLDAVVNNAGIAAPSMAFADYSADRMQRIFETNIFGAFIVAREAVRRMSTQRGGSGGNIVNMSSVAARIGSSGEYVDYAASKAAVDTMTIGLAREVADQGIRVNAVRPGLIYTDIHGTNGRPDRVDELSGGTPMKRGGQASEVADAVLWLLSEQSSFVTGSLIDVSGGR